MTMIVVEVRQDTRRRQRMRLLHCYRPGVRGMRLTAVAGRICKLVGNLPLAIMVVGKYLDASSEMGADYLNWLEDAHASVGSWGEAPECNGGGRGVWHGWAAKAAGAGRGVGFCAVWVGCVGKCDSGDETMSNGRLWRRWLIMVCW